MIIRHSSAELALLFEAVGNALLQNRENLNQADRVNANHGDHMIEVFQIAAGASREKEGESLAEEMEYAANLLESRISNGSAQTYSRGLRQIAIQMRSREISLDELISFVQNILEEENPAQEKIQEFELRPNEILKALLTGLAGWSKVEEGKDPSGNQLDLGSLFDFGVAYFQARLHSSDRIEILADTAASASPLGKIPHRRLSGMIAFRALLEAMKQANPGQTI